MNSRARNPIRIAVPLAAAAVLVASCGSKSPSANSQGQAPAQVVMAEDPGVTALPEYVASTQGFFTQSHLDVTVKPVLNIDAIPPGIMSGQFQFGMSAQPVLFAAVHSGLNLVVTAGQSVDTPAAPIGGVLVRTADAAKGAAGIAGQRAALPALKGNLADCFFNWLRADHVSSSSVQLAQVALPNMSDQLAAGQIDAAVALQPFVSLMSHHGATNLGDPCLSVSHSSAFSFQISSSSWAHSHQAVVREVETALRQADAWIAAHPTQAKAVLAQFTHVPLSVLSTVKLPEYSDYEPVSDLSNWYGVLKSLGDTNGASPDLQKLIYEPLGS